MYENKASKLWRTDHEVHQHISKVPERTNTQKVFAVTFCFAMFAASVFAIIFSRFYCTLGEKKAFHKF